MIRYFLAHWRGQQSLAWSFWVNLTALRVLIFHVQTLVSPNEGQDYSQHGALVISAIVFFHALVLLWQVIGVVRAAERDFATRGNMALVWAAQLGAVILFLLSAVHALGAWQWMLVAPEEEDPLTRMARERASLYQLSVSPSGSQLHIEGSIELGMTRAVLQLLQRNPAVSLVSLTSPGGNVYEGRALAKLFREHQLNTHTESICASACTTAFSGGTLRSVSTEAELGFHQYRLDASYDVIAVDVQKEQERDAELFRQAGVDAHFVHSLFNKSSGDMWWPSLDELLQAGMIHSISP